MSEEQALAPGEVPGTQSFLKSQKGQLIILVVLIAVVAGVWGTVWFRSAGDKPDIKLVEASSTTPAEGVETAATGTPASPGTAPAAAPSTPDPESGPAAEATGEAEIPPDVSPEEAERLERLLDRVYENRDPFKGEKPK